MTAEPAAVPEKTGLSRLMKPADPLPEYGAGDPAASTDQAGSTGSLKELCPQKSLRMSAYIGLL